MNVLRRVVTDQALCIGLVLVGAWRHGKGRGDRLTRLTWALARDQWILLAVLQSLNALAHSFRSSTLAFLSHDNG